MGWGRMFLLGNVGQQLDISDLNGEIASMQNGLAGNQELDREQAHSIEQLRRENQDLKLYLASLIRLLVAKGTLQNEEVAAIVRAIEPEH